MLVSRVGHSKLCCKQRNLRRANSSSICRGRVLPPRRSPVEKCQLRSSKTVAPKTFFLVDSSLLTVFVFNQVFLFIVCWLLVVCLFVCCVFVPHFIRISCALGLRLRPKSCSCCWAWPSAPSPSWGTLEIGRW